MFYLEKKHWLQGIHTYLRIRNISSDFTRYQRIIRWHKFNIWLSTRRTCERFLDTIATIITKKVTTWQYFSWPSTPGGVSEALSAQIIKAELFDSTWFHLNLSTTRSSPSAVWYRNSVVTVEGLSVKTYCRREAVVDDWLIGGMIWYFFHATIFMRFRFHFSFFTSKNWKQWWEEVVVQVQVRSSGLLKLHPPQQNTGFETSSGMSITFLIQNFSLLWYLSLSQ